MRSSIGSFSHLNSNLGHDRIEFFDGGLVVLRREVRLAHTHRDGLRAGELLDCPQINPIHCQAADERSAGGNAV